MLVWGCNGEIKNEMLDFGNMGCWDHGYLQDHNCAHVGAWLKPKIYIRVFGRVTVA